MLSSDPGLSKRKQYYEFAVNRPTYEFSIQERVMFQLAQTFGVTLIRVFRFVLHVQWLGKRNFLRSQNTFPDTITLASILELHLSGLIRTASHPDM
jgi:hypothetical protein